MSTSEKKGRIRTALVVLGMNMLALLFVAGASVASPLQDIPVGLADALDVDPYIAEAILSTMVLMSVALVLAVLRLPTQGVIIMLIVMIGALTAIGWLDTWLLVLIGVLVAGLFAKALLTGEPLLGSEGKQ